jgi:hypothetical protein
LASNHDTDRYYSVNGNNSEIRQTVSDVHIAAIIKMSPKALAIGGTDKDMAVSILRRLHSHGQLCFPKKSEKWS